MTSGQPHEIEFSVRDSPEARRRDRQILSYRRSHSQPRPHLNRWGIPSGLVCSKGLERISGPTATTAPMRGISTTINLDSER